MNIKEIIEKEKKLYRWQDGIEHNPKSVELFKFIAEIDFEVYSDCFCWKSGGDGDNGETLMYELDAYFDEQDRIEAEIERERKLDAWGDNFDKGW